MLVFTGVYVCVKAKLTFVSFFLYFLHLSLSIEYIVRKKWEPRNPVPAFILVKIRDYFCFAKHNRQNVFRLIFGE